jgi:hypothetical protein
MNIAPVLAPAGAPIDPNRAVYDRFGSDLMTLPGVTRSGWSKAAPGEVHIVFANDGFRRLADNVLRDAVEGVRLVLQVEPNAPAPVPGGDTWADNPGEMAKAVSAMQGIFHTSADHEHGIFTYTFSSYDPAVTERLKLLVNDNFGRYSVHFWARPLPKPPAPKP